MHYAFRSVIRLYRLHIRCPTSVLRCIRCLHSGEGTLHRIIKHCALSIAVREGLKGLKGPKGLTGLTGLTGIAHQTLLSLWCPQVYSLSRGRKWDSVQSRCYQGPTGLTGLKGLTGIAPINVGHCCRGVSAGYWWLGAVDEGCGVG